MKKIYTTFVAVLATVQLSSAQTTQTRDDAGAQVGGASGFFETAAPTNYPAGASSWWHLLDVRHTNVNNNFAMQFAGSFFDQNLYFRKTNNDPYQRWQKVLTVDNSSVLGTSVKNAILLTTIAGAVGANTLQNSIWSVRNTAGSDWSSARLHDGVSVDASFLNPQINTRTWWERDPYNDIQSWGTAANAYLTIKGGNVGIGTTTPDELLSVNGTIHSKEVKVNLTGLPDYVFKPDYHLPTLSEVKTYIDKNSHLPEMPSAQEVEKNGLNLGEMNKLLLKKVEELTLYLIEKDKEAQTQKEVNMMLLNQIDELRKQVETLLKKKS
jgi:hypothetical protein